MRIAAESRRCMVPMTHSIHLLSVSQVFQVLAAAMRQMAPLVSGLQVEVQDLRARDQGDNSGPQTEVWLKIHTAGRILGDLDRIFQVCFRELLQPFQIMTEAILEEV